MLAVQIGLLEGIKVGQPGAGRLEPVELLE